MKGVRNANFRYECAGNSSMSQPIHCQRSCLWSTCIHQPIGYHATNVNNPSRVSNIFKYGIPITVSEMVTQQCPMAISGHHLTLTVNN